MRTRKETTTEVINRTRPDFVRLRTLQIFPATPLEEAARRGDFSEADESAVVREIRGGRLDCSGADDADLRRVIHLIRSRLMP